MLVDADIAGHEVYCLNVAGPRYHVFDERDLDVQVPPVFHLSLNCFDRLTVFLFRWTWAERPMGFLG